MHFCCSLICKYTCICMNTWCLFCIHQSCLIGRTHWAYDAAACQMSSLHEQVITPVDFLLVHGARRPQELFEVCLKRYIMPNNKHTHTQQRLWCGVGEDTWPPPIWQIMDVVCPVIYRVVIFGAITYPARDALLYYTLL